MNVCDLIGHRWRKIGSRWIPTYSAYVYPVQPPKDIEVEYIDYKCGGCGATQSDEVPYSRRPLPKGGNDNG